MITDPKGALVADLKGVMSRWPEDDATGYQHLEAALAELQGPEPDDERKYVEPYDAPKGGRL